MYVFVCGASDQMNFDFIYQTISHCSRISIFIPQNNNKTIKFSPFSILSLLFL